MVNPCPGYDVDTPYKRTGKLWSLGWHTGDDYEAPEGSKIVAAAPGKVVQVSWDAKSYGQYVVIEHDPIGGKAYRSWSCHMPKGGAAVKVGERVAAGQRIGSVSDTGNATGTHLHFEARVAPFTFSAKTFVDPDVLASYSLPEAPVSSVLWYPKADRSQDFTEDYLGSIMATNCLVIHSTEGTGWPSYSGGASAPHMTIKPNFKTKTVEVRQHFASNRSARALENRSGGVETNTANVFQIELVGTCDPKAHAQWTTEHIYMPEPPLWFLQGVADVVKWLHASYPKFRIADGAPRGWKPYPSSYANKAGQRMSAAEWAKFYGIAGHQHVPENSHGDPGNFPIKALVDIAIGATPPDPGTPAPSVPPKPDPEVPTVPVKLSFNALGLNKCADEYTGNTHSAKRTAGLKEINALARASFNIVSEVNDQSDHAKMISVLGKQFGNPGVYVTTFGTGQNNFYPDANKWIRVRATTVRLLNRNQKRGATFGIYRHKDTGREASSFAAHMSSAAYFRDRLNKSDSEAKRLADIDQKAELAELARLVASKPIEGWNPAFAFGYIDANRTDAMKWMTPAGFTDIAKGGMPGDEYDSLHSLSKAPPKNGKRIDFLVYGSGFVASNARQLVGQKIYDASDHLPQCVTLTEK